MAKEIDKILIKNIVGSIFVTNFNGPVTVDSGETFTVLALLSEVNIILGQYDVAPINEIDLREELYKMVLEGLLQHIFDNNYVITEKGVDWFNDPSSN